MKKKVTAIALAVCILAVAVIGATMAYFTDTDSKTNTFTFGKVDIDLTEDSTDANGAVKGDMSTDGGITYPGVLPGLVYSKVPTVTVKRESLDAWVIITATVPTVYDWDGLFNDIDTANFTKDRKIVGENTVYYFYANAAVTAGSFVTPFTEVKINPALTQNDVTKKFDMVINAYAIQKDGFSNAEAAFAAAFTPTSADALSAAISNAKAGDTIVLQNDAVLTAPLTIDKDITIEGNGATISAQAVNVAPAARVTFKGMNFAEPDNARHNASSVYASGLEGKVVFDGCTFTNPQWECIQITPKDGAEIVVTNCTFIIDGTGTYAQAGGTKTERMLHVQNTEATGDYKVTVTNNKFIGVDMVRNSVIDIDDIAAFENVTCGENRFYNHDNTAVTTLDDSMIYINLNRKYDAASIATDTYAQFTQTPAAALHY
ncbi:MAG: TasA family protein [Clostridia bacterium]|nr:TasA family protein [Clostridia bacterium]